MYSDRYPLATAEGVQIRLDVARPQRAVKLSLTANQQHTYTVTNTASKVFSVYSETMLAIGFNELQNIADFRGIIVLANERVQFTVDADVTNLILQNIDNAVGVVVLQELYAWQDLKTIASEAVAT